MSVDFTKERPDENASTLAFDKSVHEAVRKAIACCDSEEHIVLSLESAMALIVEWDQLYLENNPYSQLWESGYSTSSIATSPSSDCRFESASGKSQRIP